MGRDEDLAPEAILEQAGGSSRPDKDKDDSGW